MVFSGRPSSACEACRPKRLRCDRIRPGCSQCSRKQIPCPGYRDASALRVRDETDRVARKVTERRHSEDCTATLANVNTATEYDAVSYFMSSYIRSCPFEEYLPSLYPTYRLDEEDVLSSAITAASLATFARRTGSRTYMQRASQKYALALTRTNVALTNPMTAVLDQTLASILLLAVFEGSIFSGARSPEEWTTHLLGATRLLQLRGMNQFQYQIGRHLYSHITVNICASCMQRVVDLPVGFRTWNTEVGQCLDQDDHLHRFSLVSQKAVSFKSRLWARLSSDRSVLFDLFGEAANIEREAAAAMNDDNPELTYTVQSGDDVPSWAYNGVVYRYKTARDAKHHNSLRMIRLFMLEVMAGGASVATMRLCNQPETILNFETARENAHRLAAVLSTEILGCVPDFVEPSSPMSNLQFRPAARTLVWPLSVVYKNRICPPEARKYAKTMMEALVTDLNRLQPVDVSKLITGPETMDDWLHLYHLD